MRPRSHVLVPLFALILFGSLVSTAHAHAVLLGSNPPDGALLATAPHAVTLIFSEAVQPIEWGIRVVGPDGTRVDRGRVQRQGDRITIAIAAHRSGTYLVLWQVLSQDTHPGRGTLTFSLRTGSPVPGSPGAASSGLGLALQTLARWLHFLGYALGFGSCAFLPVLWRARVSTEGAVESRVWRLVGLGVVLLLVSEPLMLVAEMTALGSTGPFDAGLATSILASSYGRVASQRVAAAIVLWVLVGAARQRPRPGAWGIVGLGVVLALLDGQTSHALGSHLQWLGFLSNTVHLVAMGAWLGGLIALLTLWRVPELALAQRRMVRGFGPVAAGALVSVALSGTVMAVIHLRQLSDLLSTAYGVTITAKTALLVSVCVVAGIALRGDSARQHRLWRSEVALLTAIVMLAGIVVSLPPPR